VRIKTIISKNKSGNLQGFLFNEGIAVKLDFEEIYRTHKNRVYNLALQYVQNAEDAQEITQDVFVSVHKSIEGFKAQSTLSTWIYRITINHSLDYLKARKRKKRFGFLTSLFYDGGTEIKHDSPTFDHPGVELEQKEAMERLFKLINELPDNQKTALILSRIEQKPQAEIAEIMNLSLKAVESLVQRAKVNLAKKLKSSEGS
jgi:RNA polymerase sigma-70 factor, ECF subfamily